jgi:hypothetical protein
MGPRADVGPKYRPLVRVDKEDASKHATGQLGAAGVRSQMRLAVTSICAPIAHDCYKGCI